MRSGFIMLILAAFFIVSCGDDDPVTVNAGINFKLKYNGEPLVMFDEYEYPDGRKVEFSRMSFYIEDLHLSGSEGIYTFKDRDYLNLTASHSDAAKAEQGYTYNLANVPEGNYNISFYIGVNPTDNAKDPSQFTSDDPLSFASEFWEPWQSYIFTRVEGNIDLDDNGDKETGFALHMGGDDAYRNLFTSEAFPINTEQPEMSVEIDLYKFLGGGSTIYDIDSNPQIHRLDQNEQVLELVGNLMTAFAISQ